MMKGLWAGLGLVLASGALPAQQYVISSVAGGGGLPVTPASALSVKFPPPTAAAVDASGNVYFSSGNFVFKLDGSGIATAVAGNGRAGYSGDGGPATGARINFPQGVAVDAAGDLYIADTNNNVIRQVTASGVITTVPGTGSGLLSGPYGVAVDSAGNLYIADTYNYVIRKLAVNGTMTTVAGNGAQGYLGDNGAAISAELDTPQGVAVDSAGNLYIADTHNSAIRRVAVNGTITTVAGNGNAGYLGDGGQATLAELYGPYGVTVDSGGSLYIADSYNSAIRKVASNGVITTLAGAGTGLNFPEGVALDAAGDLYIADTGNCLLRKLAPGGSIATVAGAGLWGYAGDGGPATQAELFQPQAVAWDSAGNLYIADSFNYVVRKVTPNGTITTVAGNGTQFYPPNGGLVGDGDGGLATSASLGTCYGLAVDAAGNIYIGDYDNSAVRKVSPNGMITTVAGNGLGGYSGDGGLATSAGLGWPTGVAVDAAGSVYIADTYNNVIRKVTGGVITTLAGDGYIYGGFYGDGGLALNAELNSPGGLAVDAAGNVYIADSNNSAVRRVATNGTITTVAGIGGYWQYYGAGDGGPATSAYLVYPTGVAVDATGNLYIADYYDLRIRKVATNGIITTAAGSSLAGYAGDGGPASQAQFESPAGVAVDPAGNVYVADDLNNLVRILVPGGTHALLSVASAHSGSFTAGSAGAVYSLVVSNTAGAGATSGTVTLTETAPAGLTLVSMAGTGWNCSASACSRSDALAAGSSYPPITATVNVAAGLSSWVVNQVAVSGGGSAAASGTDPTLVVAAVLAAPVLVSPANGATGVADAAVLTWNAATGAVSYDVYFGTSSAPSLVTNTTATSYAPGTLTAGQTYYWQIVAQNGSGSAASPTWSFTTVAPAAGLRFVPVTPCRLVDTRMADGPFGGPAIEGSSSRSFAIPQSVCGIPSTAQAYSLNVTAVPDGPLYFLTLWPTGQPQANASTLNSWGGTVVANAAIVPAGTGGAVSIYASNPTDVILDINGYFDSGTGATSFWFYPVTPCRVADTRGATGTFGGPAMYGGQTRGFPLPSGSCVLPSSAAGYSLNVTVVPDPVIKYLGFLSTWPTGQAQPVVSTLNSWTGKVVANAAIVPSGTNGSINVFVTNPTDVILDTNGYFAGPGTGGLSFYPVAPCRVADTRGPNGPFGGPEMAAAETRSFTIPASACYVPPTAAAYSLNVTVVPDGVLSYLIAWPTGSATPLVSTLNSFDGSVVANAAIVPAGTGGAISVFVLQQTQVILDINGYFAP